MLCINKNYNWNSYSISLFVSRVFTHSVRLISTKNSGNYSHTHSCRMPQIQLKQWYNINLFRPLTIEFCHLGCNLQKILAVTKQKIKYIVRIMFAYVRINSFLERGILKLMEFLECVSHRPFLKFPETSV